MSKGFVSGLMTGICYLALQSGAYSQEQTEPQELGPIVVTASRSEQSLDEVTRSVAVMESEQIERAVADSVTEVLRDVPGINIIDSNVAGMKRISIRGEESSRNVVLVDGQEISDHTSYGAVFLISPSDIERIEVVKGPGSVLHGSKAIGGVVNIITKKGADRAVQVEIGTAFDSSTDGITGFSSAAGTIDQWDYRFSASKSKHGDRETANGTLEGSAFENQSVTAYVGYTGDQHKFSIKAERFEQESEVYTDPADIGLVMRQFDMDLPKRDRSKIGIFYDFTDVSESIAKVHLDGYVQQIDRVALVDYELAPPRLGAPVMKRENETESKLLTFGLNGQVDLTLFDNVLTSIGFQAVQDQLDKDSFSTGTNTISVPGPVIPVNIIERDEAKLTTLSAFLQNEWDLNDDLTLTAGGRYYFVASENKGTAGDRDESDQAFVGALGLNYTGFENFALRAHVSQGYVYPTLLQSTLGSVFSPAGKIYGNADLDPETSMTAEIGARFDRGNLIVDASAFYTGAKDYITSVDCDAAVHGSKCTANSDIYVNIDAAKTWGLELAASYQFAELAVTPYANITLMRRQFSSGATNTFDTDTPLVSGRLGVMKSWAFDNGVEAYADLYSRFSSEHRQKDSSGIDEADGFATLNLAGGFSYDFDEKHRLKVHAAVENIFDQDYKPSVEELTAPGRAFKISASVVF
ncbi:MULTISPECIES: TonB-dependent receptor [unclassified Pseudovibrio]|uniref:TonB-dependent receptor plug domain-containing protein n=1 Tax=unclassified Pseudovibrio TaxID=2627060 RepID=UPI0007AE38A0|nr:MULTISPECIES: TonB-dependent receptor [unclassified Pseudovibrio]KZL03053.1 Colicin I receptor precursor [Pseudovibrio sp. W74]KZL04928.1 Colicin I receptor precursor [Pseudovibrio sp. Ad14]